MNRVDKAVELFQNGQSCSNAVFGAFCDCFGVEESTAFQLASGFGGGVGGRGELCGAVCGMVMAGSMGLDYTDKPAVRAQVNEMVEAFIAQYGTTTCKDLKDWAAKNPPADPDEKACARFVRAAAAQVAAKLEEK